MLFNDNAVEIWKMIIQLKGERVKFSLKLSIEKTKMLLKKAAINEGEARWYTTHRNNDTARRRAG